MKYAIVVSRKDDAGMNIKENLLSNYKFSLNADNQWINGDIGIVEIEEESIYAEDLDRQIWSDFIIFATKHKSAAGKNSLSVHFPGNWGNAKMGGKKEELCVAPASLMKDLFLELNERAQKNKTLGEYEVTLEATHHGPLLLKPCMFIEVGSSAEQWNDPVAGKAVADTLMAVLKNSRKKYKTIIGIGGTHYPDAFNKIMINTQYAVGHICPKYALPSIGPKMIEQAVKRTCEKVEFAALDWKGLGSYKSKIVEILDKLDIPFRKTKDLLGSAGADV